MRPTLLAATMLVTSTLIADQAAAQNAADLAKKLSNPIAALISVPLQLNYDQAIGATEDGDKWVLNVQPVIPISLNDDWNLISRTILPIVSQHDIYPGAGSQSGSGDVVQSLFFSPTAPTAGGWIWGAGPVLLLPTGSNDLLTADKWGAGPTAVVLRQQGGWTYGALTNHIWSFAGNGDRADLSVTFLQPFLSFGTPTAWTFGLNTDNTYDWKTAATSTTTVSAPTPSGGRARGAVAGAAAGAAAAEVRGNQYENYDRVDSEVQQEYRQNQAQDAAVAGAVVGESRQRRDRRQQTQTQQAQSQQQAQQQSTTAAQSADAASKQTFSACMSGKGYTITP